jgi:hypothetical protein
MIAVQQHKSSSNVFLSDSDMSTLVQLASYPDSRVRRLVAERQNTPGFLLCELARDKDEDVRLSAAENPNIPLECLSELLDDPSCDVRFALAENSNMPIEMLRALVSDDNPYVACRAQATLILVHAAASVIPLKDFAVQAFPHFNTAAAMA